MIARRVCLACILVSAPAAAAPGGSDPVAEQLFRDGKDAMKRGDVAGACAAYDASEHTEHNVSTAMNLADCRERLGQLASAWALYLQVVAESRTDAALTRLAALALARATAIEPHLSYLVVNVPEEHRTTGLAITRDHVPLDPGAWNHAIPVDGGDHLVEARAPGHETWSTTVWLAPRDARQSVEIPKFSDLAPLVAPPTLAAPSTIRARPLTDTPPPARTRRLPIALAAGGAVALGVGTGLWLHARSLHAQADVACPPTSCDAVGASDANGLERRARHWAIGGDATLAIGGAALVGGAVLYLLGPRDATALQLTPTLGDQPGVALGGSF